jgi:hypothetical protein
LAPVSELRSAIRVYEGEKAEDEIADVEEALAKDLWSAAPQSVAGVAAKLHSVLEIEDPGSALKEAPWPELRTILADLVRICVGLHAI